MIRFLKRPYPITKSAEKRLLTAIAFGLFVFGFLYLFLPFGLSELHGRILFTCIVFGLICSGCMLFFSFVVAELFPNYFSERHWNVGREIFWASMHIVVIGFFNALFALSIGMGEFSFPFLLLFLSFTFMLGIFPITISVLITEARLNRKYRAESGTINSGIKEHPIIENQQGEVILQSDNKDEDLTLHPDEILLLAAADNYVEVVFLKNDEIRKNLLRTTLKTLEDRLTDHPALLRIHKSYLVNLAHVEKVSGNAQGYRLHLKNCEEVVPVSRKNNSLFRERMSSLAK